jgi:Zn-dependent protease
VLGGNSIQLGRIFGIRIGVDISWFFVLFLFIWSLSGWYQDLFPGDDTKAFTLAVISSLLFFLSILLHELGHAAVAIRNGIPILGIDLWMFGGVAKLGRDTDSPGVEFRVAVTGPLVTLAIWAVCFGAASMMSSSASVWDAGRFEIGNFSEAVAVLGYLSTVNFFVLLFNLIPGFPLDGGRIARAIAWKLTGDRNRATRFAARLGRLAGWGMVGYGILALADVLPGGSITGIWFVFIGIFLSSAARSAEAQAEFSDRIDHLRVSDVMDAEPVAIPGEMTIGDALHEYFLRYRYDWFPVVDRNGRFVGIVDRERAERIPEDRHTVFTVREILRAEDDNVRVSSDEPLEALLGSPTLMRLGALMAVDRDGRLQGIVTWDQVRRALQQPTGAATP